MSTALVIWIIGWLFTVGVAVEDDLMKEGWDTIVVVIFLLFFGWAVGLGIFVSESVKEIGGSNSDSSKEDDNGVA